jgi:hypothetical protein
MPPAGSSALRFAIVGSPRSGNMWLRPRLVSALELEELTADTSRAARPLGLRLRLLRFRAAACPETRAEATRTPSVRP